MIWSSLSLGPIYAILSIILTAVGHVQRFSLYQLFPVHILGARLFGGGVARESRISGPPVPEQARVCFYFD